MENTEEKYPVHEESECIETQMKEEVNRSKLRRLLEELVRPENLRALYSVIAVQSKRWGTPEFYDDLEYQLSLILKDPEFVQEEAVISKFKKLEDDIKKSISSFFECRKGTMYQNVKMTDIGVNIQIVTNYDTLELSQSIISKEVSCKVSIFSLLKRDELKRPIILDTVTFKLPQLN